jgi:hypothetical protein
VAPRASTRAVVWDEAVTSWKSPDPEDPAVEAEQLKDALATQPVIEQAKGMIMLLHTCTDEEAFTALREVSQHTNMKVHTVAAVIVATGSRAEQPDELTDLDQESVTAVLDETRRLLGTAFG